MQEEVQRLPAGWLHTAFPAAQPVAVCIAVLAMLAGLAASAFAQAEGLHVRFKMVEPADTTWYVQLGGYIHVSPWNLPGAVWPVGADNDQAARVLSGQPSPWLDLKALAGDRLHGRLDRAGGVAEFPNVTASFMSTADSATRKVVIELATAPDEQAVVKRFEESYTGSLTSFLVSTNLRQDADSLETASQMSARRLGWAREVSGGQRVSPEHLIIETSFWAPQRPELNVQEGEVLWLLGFNMVGNQMPEVRDRFHFVDPGGHHWVEFGPDLTREQIDEQIRGPAEATQPSERTTLFGLSDEVCCRPPIGDNPAALAHFRAWLKDHKVRPKDLGVKDLTEVKPIESPVALRERQEENLQAANRVFLYTTRFRQQSATERIRWLTESFHKYAAENILTSTLVADHPYFAGSGLGMGMHMENAAWGDYPLSLDWFALGRQKAADVIGIEDWMGLQYMYGPDYTWEGFQLMGFQASIFRSGSRGALPIIAWITPSDDTNVRLKTASALCQGAKHFFYWTYGPTATSTENYWSDLRGEYEGIAAVTRQLAAAEHIIAPGKTRPTRVALLYSLSSDLWQPLGYVHMLERRLTYLSLVHDQYLVDMLTEEDIEGGRLGDYAVLYATDPCITPKACEQIRLWVKKGGRLYASCAAGSRDEFDQPVRGLAAVLGLRPEVQVTVQPGPYHVRGALNGLHYLDTVQLASGDGSFGAIGVKVAFKPRSAKVIGTFQDGSPAVTLNRYGNGTATYVGTCPAISYAKDARFVPAELKERWPAVQRAFINAAARESGAPRLAELSQPVVEAGVYDAPSGTALVLANFTYEPIAGLEVRLPVRQAVKQVRSVTKGPLEFTIEPAAPQAGPLGYPAIVRCKLDLGLSDIVLFE